jgi:hypothetical protein
MTFFKIETQRAYHNLGPNIRKHRIKMERGVEEGLKQVAEFILNESRTIVPVDTSSLKQSSRVIMEQGFGFDTVYRVGYGIPGEVYAVDVNERTGKVVEKVPYDYALYVHNIPPNSGGRWGTGNKHEPPTQYLFLSSTINKGWQTMSNIFVSVMQYPPGGGLGTPSADLTPFMKAAARKKVMALLSSPRAKQLEGLLEAGKLPGYPQRPEK